jgi:hypothetical protein
MNMKLSVTVSMILLATAGVVTNASAQEKTRAEVRQELIQAENNGSRFVTDTSYPDVNPVFAQQVARLKLENESGMGADMSGSSASGRGRSADVAGVANNPSAACVGPAGFCKPYFGS